MSTSVLHTSQPRLSFQAMSPEKDNYSDVNEVFILTESIPKGNGSISSTSSVSKKEVEGRLPKKGTPLPNVMEKSLLKRLNVGMRSKKAWGGDESRERNRHFEAPESRRDGVTSVVTRSSGSRTNVSDNAYFHLPSLHHSRQYLLSRDSTRPRPRQDSLQGMEDDAGFHKNLLSKKVEEAIEAAKKIKDRVREDKETGVPSGFGSNTLKGLKIIDESQSIAKALRKSRKLAKQLADGEAGRKDDTGPEEKKRHRKSRAGDKIPGNFQFPKQSDFIPIATDKKRVDPIHVDWSVCGGENFYRESTSTLQGKLSKSCYNPVTGALHKEGSSVSRKQGKVLRQGDFNVSKVWSRPSNDISVNVLPTQMAREDITLERGSRKLKSKRVKPLSNHSSAPKSEGVERDSDIDVFSITDRLTEIMEMPEEEEEE